MAKKFAPRVGKRQLKQRDITEGLDDSIFRLNDEKLLKGALLDTISLSKIEVRKQVRTKFNDDSLKELAQNIKENGLIQPLVIHREKDKYVLICGERRFRAMGLIDMKEAPCFILENKTPEELMAIQFSENAAREELHYIDQADSIYGFKQLTGYSERKIQAALGSSKSEVHRCILIGKMPREIKEAAKMHNIEKYVLLEWDAIETDELKEELKEKIIAGKITKRSQIKRAINQAGGKSKVLRSGNSVSKTVSANVLIKALKSKSKDMDPATKKALNDLLQETQDVIDL